MEKKIFIILIISTLFLTFFAGESNRRLTVMGNGKVMVNPDIAYIYIGVETENESAEKSIKENNQKTEKIIETIKISGVKKEDIKTTNFTLFIQPLYDKNSKKIGNKYVVNNTLFLLVRDLNNLGKLLDNVVKSGANQIYNISFDVANRSKFLLQARKEAVKDAKLQAEEVANAAGVEIKEIETISYYDSSPSPFYRARTNEIDAFSSVPIESGRMDISSTVTIVYTLK